MKFKFRERGWRKKENSLQLSLKKISKFLNELVEEHLRRCIKLFMSQAGKFSPSKASIFLIRQSENNLWWIWKLFIRTNALLLSISMEHFMMKDKSKWFLNTWNLEVLVIWTIRSSKIGKNILVRLFWVKSCSKFWVVWRFCIEFINKFIEISNQTIYLSTEMEKSKLQILEFQNHLKTQTNYAKHFLERWITCLLNEWKAINIHTHLTFGLLGSF